MSRHARESPATLDALPLTVALSPEGHINVHLDPAAQAPPAAVSIAGAFERGAAAGLLHLAGPHLTTELPPDLGFWRELGRLVLAQLCAIPDLESHRSSLSLPPPLDQLSSLVDSAPLMLGGEYLSTEVLAKLWDQLKAHLEVKLPAFQGTAEDFLHTLNPAWNLVGRVYFHLAENKQNPDRPFAFLATYTSSLSAKAKAQHQPLAQALSELSAAEDKKTLLSLLKPVQQAANQSPFLQRMLEKGELYKPQAWSAEEAFRFLREIPAFETAGIIVRVPDWWHARRPPRPEVQVTLGKNAASGLGLNALLDFDVRVTLDGKNLTKAELRTLLAGPTGLVQLKGHWVEVDRDKLEQVLQHWENAQAAVAEDGLSFADALRLLAGASKLAGQEQATPDASFARIIPGPWLAETLKTLRSPEAEAHRQLGKELKASLRPYQEAGLSWLLLLHTLKLGACLADDMGLGKTIQVLALLLLLKKQKKAKTLLVVPASLIGNWLREAERFAPSLKIQVLHPSVDSKAGISAPDLVLTTYSMLSRFPEITSHTWSLLVLDEAQAIKNPNAKQTRLAKAVPAEHRLALTGTPIENRPGDLWSLFDFLSPGLLGSASAFQKFISSREAAGTDPYAALRGLVKPYILRRLKTDKTVIADLPDKTEVRAYCSLSKQQAALYQDSVDELKKLLTTLADEPIKRRGVVLAFLLRFKQICNHPAQWLGTESYDAEASGKFARLTELADEIAARQEKVLVFTQFRAMADPLAAHLAKIFGRPGLVLHGETEVKKRQTLVDAFQQDGGPPFFVLSLKAGGTGLNLTAASHVLHFDRWWNPAVENQATDRAFRIGQKRNVLVHKFVCRGTVEDKIDAMIEAKTNLSAQILEGSNEAALTELNDDELLKFVALDLNSIQDAEQG